MKMENLTFESAARHKKEIKRLYRTAFPKEERAPLFFLYRRARQGIADFCAVLDGEKFVGLTYAAGTETVVTLMFLAIEDGERGRGYGSRILKAVREKYRGRRLFLNIEPLDTAADNYEQRVKRKAFYERNGFSGLDYTVREAGVTYDMMTCGGYVSLEEYRAVMERCLGRVWYTLVRLM